MIGADIKEPIVAGGIAALRSVRETAQGIVANFNTLRSDLNAAATGAINALYDPIIKANQLAATEAEISATKQKLSQKDLTGAERKEYEARLTDLRRTQLQQNADLLTYGTQAEQISKTKAFLASGFWAQAYRDATPEQKAALDDWHQALVDRLDAMQKAALDGGADTREGFVGELNKGGPKVGAAINTWDAAADRAFAAAKANALKWGKSTGQAYADGLEASYGNIHSAATYAASGATGAFKASSPPGPESPLHLIDVWGFKTMEAWAKGLRKGIDANLGMITGGLMAYAQATKTVPFGMPDSHPSFNPSAASGERFLGAPSRVGPVRPGAAAGTTYIQQNKVELTGLVKARDPFEISNAMERFQRTGVFEWPEHEK